jgi:hypothetical protein
MMIIISIMIYSGDVCEQTRCYVHPPQRSSKGDPQRSATANCPINISLCETRTFYVPANIQSWRIVLYYVGSFANRVPKTPMDN